MSTHLFPKTTATIALFVAASGSLSAQSKIADGSVTPLNLIPNPSAILEIESANKGLLISRIALTNTSTWGLAGTTPVAGMMIYNTAAGITSTDANYPALPGGVGQYYWDGTGWVGMKFNSASGWGTTGNAGTNSSQNFLGTTDNHPLKLKVNNALAGFIDSAVSGSSTTYGYLAGNSSIGVSFKTFNTFLGYQAGTTNTVTANTNQGRNTGVGYNALQYLSSGYENTAVGYIAMQGNDVGHHNTALGSQAMANASGSVNSNSGDGNVAVGWKTLYSNSGSYNIGVGFWALGSANVPGNNNTGNYNIAMGYQTLYNNTSGANNLAIGYHAGYTSTTGHDNVLLGYNAGSSFTTESNRLIISNATATLVDGNFSTGVVTLNSVLKLSPLTAAPSPAEKGMIYFDGISNIAYCYDGTSWKALW